VDSLLHVSGLMEQSLELGYYLLFLKQKVQLYTAQLHWGVSRFYKNL